MASKKYFIDPGVQTDPQTLLKTGKVAMAYFGTFFTGQLTSVGMKSDQDYGVFVLPNVNPSVTKQQVALETGPLCVGAGSQDEQAAMAYSAWWMGQDAQQAWSDKRGDISFNPKVKASDPALSALLQDQGELADPEAVAGGDSQPDLHRRRPRRSASSSPTRHPTRRRC